MNFFVKNICFFAITLLGTMVLSAQQPSEHEGLLLVAFGTSHQKALTSYHNTEKTLCSHFPIEYTSWAYTSGMIRHKLAKGGHPIPSIQEGMKKLASTGVKTLRVQSLHIAAGEEFSQMERIIQRYLAHNPESFEKVFIGRPLLESSRDMREVIHGVLSDFSSERKPDEAILLMGHGQSEGRSDLVFTAVQGELKKQDSKAFLATVEGTYSFKEALAELKTLQAKGLTTVWLAPFMIVAGDHANNDLAGDDKDSWASQLKKAGFTVKIHLKGLGDIKKVQDIFLRHAIETKDDIIASSKEKE
ncbi:MAG: sirohydrochlorin cobaltochelatase [Akkermansia sp.]